jgi:hypothetical protein
MVRPSSQRGSAIIMIFIAVALFGMLAYAFSQGSRTSMGWIEKERQDAAVTGAQDCTNAINMAQKRLQARGCGSMISSLADGSNPNTGAPSDGSCSIFHPNGGGVKADCVPAPSSTDSCTTGAIGTACSDGAIYIGDAGGNRIYAAAADESSALQWKTVNTATSGTSDTSDGQANTDAMMADDPALHPAGNACATKAPLGTWYMPANDELNLVWTNRADIDLAATGFSTGGSDYYWSSTEFSAAVGTAQSFNNGAQGGLYTKNGSYLVRCVRR